MRSILNINAFCGQNVEFLNIKHDGKYSNQRTRGYRQTDRHFLLFALSFILGTNHKIRRRAKIDSQRIKVRQMPMNYTVCSFYRVPEHHSFIV